MISIHAPSRGATFAHRLGDRIEHHFNPRALTGRDRHSAILAQYQRHFNPRALTGRDPPHLGSDERQAAFQSTRPHGARPVPLNA